MGQIFSETQQGFKIVGLKSDSVVLKTVPQLGAKLLSLVHPGTGREWMWYPASGLKLHANKTRDSFPDSTLSGADECIPTISACKWRGLDLTDHGEAWTEAWTLDDKALEKGTIRTSLKLPISPLEMERSISLEGDRLTLKYSAKHVGKGKDPFEFVWALHPMMTVAEGDEIILPAEVKSARVDCVLGREWGGRGTALPWPSPAPGARLDKLDFGSGPAGAIKLYTDPLKEKRAALRNTKTGAYILFETDADTYGIWINRGGWADHHHVALEPTNGAPDPLDLAAKEWKRCWSLSPGETRAWSVKIALGADAKTPGKDLLSRRIS